MPHRQRPKRTEPTYKKEKYNLKWQYYKGVPVKLICYTEKHFATLKAKRFMLGKTGNQNIWIPNSCLLPDGTLNPDMNLDWIFRRAWFENKFKYANIEINPTYWS